MALYISSDCTSCGKCIDICPTRAIYEGGMVWNIIDGTEFSGGLLSSSASDFINEDDLNQPLEISRYFIVSEKCVECKGFYEKPKCKAVCPEICIFKDDEVFDTGIHLENKLIDLFPLSYKNGLFDQKNIDSRENEVVNRDGKDYLLEMARNHLNAGEIEKALSVLAENFGDKDDVLILMRGQYKRAVKETLVGVLDSETKSRELNKIAQRIYLFIESKK